VKRVGLILKDCEFNQFMENNATKETGRKFCCHDLSHVIDVARVAYTLFLEKILLQEDYGFSAHFSKAQAKEIVYAAGLLHDIGRWCEYETGEDHARAGGLLAQPILTRAGFEIAEQEIIIRAIKEHRKNIEENSFLGQILYRADKFVRLCNYCSAKDECYKLDSMETAREILIY